MSIFDTTPLIEKDEANALIAKLFTDCPKTSEYLNLAKDFWSSVVQEYTMEELTYEKIDSLTQGQLQTVEKAEKVCEEIILWLKNNVAGTDKNGNIIQWKLSVGTMRNFCGVKVTLKESSLLKGSAEFSGVLETLSPYRDGDKRFFPANTDKLFSVEKTVTVKAGKPDEDFEEDSEKDTEEGSEDEGGGGIFDTKPKLTEDEAKYLINNLINSCPKTSEFLNLATQFWSLEVTYHSNDQTYSTAVELTDEQIKLVEKAEKVCDEIISWMEKNSVGKDSHGNDLKWKFSLGSMRNFYAVKVEVNQGSTFQGKVSFTGVLEIFSAYRDGDKKYFPDNIDALFSTEKVTASDGGDDSSDYSTDTGITDTNTDTGITDPTTDTGVADTDTKVTDSDTEVTSGTTLAKSTYGLTDWIAFTEGAKNWGIEMERASSTSEIIEALKKGTPVIVLHPKGILGETKQFVVYAKLSGEDDLTINSPSSPNSADSGPDTKTWSLAEVLKDAVKDGGNLIAWIPTTQNEKVSAKTNAAGIDIAGIIDKVSQFKGYTFKSFGEMVLITALPSGLTYCEPIYPDYVTVEDETPQWALTAAANIDGKNKEAAERAGYTSVTSSDTATGNSTTDKTQSPENSSNRTSITISTEKTQAKEKNSDTGTTHSTATKSFGEEMIVNLFDSCPYISEYNNLAKNFFNLFDPLSTKENFQEEFSQHTDYKDKAKTVCNNIVDWLKQNAPKTDEQENKLAWKISREIIGIFWGVKVEVSQGDKKITGALSSSSRNKKGNARYITSNENK